MNMQFDYMPNDERTDPRDASRPWGRLTATMHAGTSVLTASLWPDGRHVIKIPRPNIGAVVTAAQLAEFARMVESTAEWCAGNDDLVVVLRAAAAMPRAALADPGAVMGGEA